ncbi:MAG: hypothetical protein EXS55_04775 [Candidatus Magasanikbacteria bacterium]|nr:hypothetical protein [Candidatus Magasanikbacteria bacterium]
MNFQIPVYQIHLPEYVADKEPDHEAVGVKVDELIKQHWIGQHIAIRCVGSSEHPGKTTDDMIDIIKQLGHDRYDPERQGDRYENNEGKKIDIFAFDYYVEKDTKMFSVFTWPFFNHEGFGIGRPIKIDIVIIYDPAKLNVVEFTYAGREHEGVRSDGFIFKDPQHKSEAIKGIIKIV